MLRMQRLLSLWNWLPTFRAVAEEQHVSRAAEQLGVSPSAVSRMLGLLEADVGQALFHRVGRRIELNDAGVQLLRGVRSAMRMVDESLAAVANAQFVGELRVATAEPVTRSLVLPALEQLQADHPKLVPVLLPQSADPAAALLRGDVDVALAWQVTELPQLSVERIAALELRVYATRTHPLAGERGHTLTKLARHSFVLTPLDAAGVGWPRQQRRAIALRVPDVGLAVELCAAGKGLAVLPEVLVAALPAARRARLSDLTVKGIRPLEVFAHWRMQLDLLGRADELVQALSARGQAMGTS